MPPEDGRAELVGCSTSRGSVSSSLDRAACSGAGGAAGALLLFWSRWCASSSLVLERKTSATVVRLQRGATRAHADAAALGRSHEAARAQPRLTLADGRRHACGVPRRRLLMLMRDPHAAAKANEAAGATAAF